MYLRSSIGAVVAACMAARDGLAQTVADPPSALGFWRGTSICQVRPSPCTDEVVVYRITRLQASDSIALDARKIFSSREIELGVLICRLARGGASFTCAAPTGAWNFTLGRDSLIGELRLPDSTTYRVSRVGRPR